MLKNLEMSENIKKLYQFAIKKLIFYVLLTI